MTVRVNKDSFNLREKLSELERPIGLKGSELMSADTAQEARDLVSAGRKNLIINGDMRIAQRGTTSTVDNNYGCVDRWFKYSSGDTSTWGQATDPVHGTYAYWVAKSNGYGNLRQRIEPFFVPTEGINFTASFWMKISSGTCPLRYEIWNNSDNSLIKSNVNHDTLTTEWKKYTVNFRLDSSDSMDNWHLMLGSNGAPANVTFYLTKCQIERGDIATEFEHRSIGEELELCQRYYERHNFTASQYIAASISHNTGTGSRFVFPFLTRKRTTDPSVTFSGTYKGYPPNETVTLSGSDDNDTAARINVDRTTSYSAGTGILILANSGAFAEVEDEL